MSIIDNGGPAFPHVEWDIASVSCDRRYEILKEHHGLPIRDWIATTLTIPPGSVFDVEFETARMLTGKDCPPGRTSIARLKYWARVDAIVRYIQADAMLAERDKSQPSRKD